MPGSSPASAATTSAPAVPVAGQKAAARAGPMSVSSARVGSTGLASVGVGAGVGSGVAASVVGAKSSARRYGSSVVGARSGVTPAWIWVARSASPNWSAKRELGSDSRRSSHRRASSGAEAPSTRIAAGIAGSTARIAGVPVTASSCAVRAPSGPVSSVSSAAVRRPSSSGPATIGTTTPTDAGAPTGGGTVTTLATARGPASVSYTARSG